MREGLTEKAVWHTVKDSAKSIGVAKSAPHDLRRTCARLCRFRGRVGTDPIRFGPRIGSNGRTLLAASSGIRSAVDDRIGIEPNP